MRHVITGGSGFTGRALVGLLAKRREEVVIFDLVPPTQPSDQRFVTFIAGDVTRNEDFDRLALRPGDFVYHLAARQFASGVPARGRDEWFAAVNVVGTENLLNAMRKGGSRRLIFFSTDMTYGIPTSCPVPPNHAQNPIGPYGKSKLEAERRIRAADGIQSTIFRPRLITGRGRLGILAQLFKLIRAGLPVPMIGAGKNRYQMVGVDDCARAAILAVEKGCPPGPFNLGSSTPPTTRQLLQCIISHSGSRSILIPMPAPLLKPILGALDRIGLTLLYPEQFGIADIDILLDTSDTERVLGWRPLRDDVDMMNAAYDAFVSGHFIDRATSTSI
jgi:nucleoside-diphosphate-sugar epimerase